MHLKLFFFFLTKWSLLGPYRESSFQCLCLQFLTIGPVAATILRSFSCLNICVTLGRKRLGPCVVPLQGAIVKICGSSPPQWLPETSKIIYSNYRRWEEMRWDGTVSKTEWYRFQSFGFRPDMIQALQRLNEAIR